MLALQRKVLGSPKAQRRQKKKIVPAENVDERTPLRNSYNDLPYVPGEEVQEGDIPGEDSDDDRLSREVDVVFGKFPGRLLNHHVSHFLYFLFAIPLIPITTSGGTGNLNQLYAVIMPPTSTSVIALRHPSIARSIICNQHVSHVFIHSIFTMMLL